MAMNTSQLQPIEAPISAHVANEAAEWYAQLCSGVATDSDRELWKAWRERDPQHRRAWERIEALQAELQSIASKVSYKTLTADADSKLIKRRAALKSIALFVAGGSAAWVSWGTLPWREWTAGYRTAVGERRDLVLEDGSKLTLNTTTAVSIAFSSTRRLVELRAGEILAETAADPAHSNRPFIVESADGTIRALGTRFTVRKDDALTRVAVLRDAVEIVPVRAAARKTILKEGHKLAFSESDVQQSQFFDEAESAWSQGTLIVNDWRLGDFIAELSRYRPGWLICDWAVASYRISGAFPLTDTDIALAAVEKSFPVRVIYRTRYWVTVEPR
jgi:transmembrane sensor